MRAKIADFLVRTQKATAALLAATTAVASATFLPEPWAAYAAVAGLVLTWVLTYVFPFVAKAVEAFPIDDAPLEGEVIEPTTDEIEVVYEDTAGIPVVEHEVPVEEWTPPFTGAVRVEDVLARLDEERVTV